MSAQETLRIAVKIFKRRGDAEKLQAARQTLAHVKWRDAEDEIKRRELWHSLLSVARNPRHMIFQEGRK